MIHVHYAAVHSTPSQYYSSETLEAWSRTPDEARYRWMEELILNDHALLLVAERSDEILGFTIFMKNEGLLRALYVHPAASRSGIGGLLLRAVEEYAVGDGTSCISVNSSLNAESFYRKNGYVVIAEGKFRLSAEHEMDCIKMEKLF
jgi:putative acetyltransferase